MTDRVKLLAAVALVVCAESGCWVTAEEFRVENRVFVGDQKTPCSESTTLFLDNFVYDYLANPSEITVFDKTQSRFVLLDQARRVKTEVPMAQVREFTERLKQWALTQPDAQLKFLVEPQFEEQYNDSNHEFTFASPWLTYRVVAPEIENQQIVRQYSEFSDWTCQLNTFLNPGTRPPFARMLVNATLEARQRFPHEVHLTLRSRDRLLPKRVAMRSEHDLISELIQADRERITQTNQFLAIFTPVKFTEYQKRMEK